MQYLGGKAKIAKRVVAAILAHTTERGRFVEPFCGAANVTAEAAPHFREVCASDAHEDLILLWRALLGGWTPPTAVSEAEYAAAKAAPPSALRGFIGFGTSWGGKWFGGYARRKDGCPPVEESFRGAVRKGSVPHNYAAGSGRGLLRKAASSRKVEFVRAHYQDVRFAPGDVIYCDPPYAATTGYSGDAFDSAAFWRWAAWASLCGAHVFVSEYAAPPGWKAIWSVERTRDLKADTQTAVKVTENLFVLA